MTKNKMKIYRIIHIPTGEFYDSDEKYTNDLANNLANKLQLRACISIPCRRMHGCEQCPWWLLRYKTSEFEYDIQEIK